MTKTRDVDMSPKAIADRLEVVRQLNRLAASVRGIRHLGPVEK